MNHDGSPIRRACFGLLLVAGCTAVQVGTATFVRPTAIAEVHAGIAAFLAARGLASLADLPRYLPKD